MAASSNFDMDACDFSDIDSRIVEIYTNARNKYNESLWDNDVSNEFVQQILDIKNENGEGVINFGQAARLDAHFFGKHGGYWRTAYGCPAEGDLITAFGVDNLRVTSCGLLTMSIDDESIEEDVFCTEKCDDETTDSSMDCDIYDIDNFFIGIYVDARAAYDARPEDERSVVLNKAAMRIMNFKDKDGLCPLNSDQASRLDNYFFGKSGEFWRAAYCYPVEGEEIDGLIVSNCGLLTMNLS